MTVNDPRDTDTPVPVTPLPHLAIDPTDRKSLREKGLFPRKQTGKRKLTKVVSSNGRRRTADTEGTN